MKTLTLDKTKYLISPVSIGIARALVEHYHYMAGASNTATYLHGLFHQGHELFDGECIGVAWWLPPTKSAGLATFPNNPQGVLSLSRFVLVPELPTNSASYLLGRSMRLIDRSRWPCLVTYADPAEGHTGVIYKATNWRYMGPTKPEPVYILNGRIISRKAGPKTRTKKEMEVLGAQFVGNRVKYKFIHLPKILPSDGRSD